MFVSPPSPPENNTPLVDDLIATMRRALHVPEDDTRTLEERLRDQAQLLDLAMRRTLSDSENTHSRNEQRSFFSKSYYELALTLQNQCRKTALAVHHIERSKKRRAKIAQNVQKTSKTEQTK